VSVDIEPRPLASPWPPTIWTPPADLVLPDDVDMALVVPRVCHYPTETYAYSAGLDAIEQAASAGLTLDTWQQLVIQLGLGKTGLGRWAAFQVALIVARQNGKGAILEALELYWLFISGEPLVGHSAHEYKTAMEAFRRVLFLITNTDWMRKKVKKVINTNGEEGIELLTGQRLRFMARSKGAGRGFSFHKLVWDEAYALTGEQQDAQLPTMSAMPDPQVWLTSSPPLDAASGAALFRLRRLAAAMAPDMVFLDYGAPGALDDLSTVDLDDRETWKRTNPSYWTSASHSIKMQAIERERASMSDVGFARERLGIWPPDLSEGFTVISKAQWDAMLDPHSGKSRYEDLPATMGYWPEPDLSPSDPRWQTPPTKLVRRPAIAIHVSARNNGSVRSSIGLAQYRFDGKIHIELIKNGLGSNWVIQDAIRLAAKTNACAIVIDPGSPAGSLLAGLENAIKLDTCPLVLEIIVKMTSGDVARAFGMIYDAATSKDEKDHNVVQLGQHELTVAIGGAVKRVVGDGHAWDSRNASTDLTTLVSVTHALWGLATKGNEVEAVPLVVWA
jgi:hypothetical protein